MDIAKIDMLIRVVRGQRVMMDRDLAELYGVATKVLNQAVKRHGSRFPEDFMFTLNPEEARNWKSQIVTSNSGVKMGHRKPPHAFTEQGVAMLSSVLNSERAVQVNVAIMRAFVRLRHALAANKDLADRMEKAEKRLGTHEAALGEHAQAIRSVFEDIRSLMGPPDGPRRKIGFAVSSRWRGR